jgi:hypothetical protein
MNDVVSAIGPAFWDQPHLTQWIACRPSKPKVTGAPSWRRAFISSNPYRPPYGARLFLPGGQGEPGGGRGTSGRQEGSSMLPAADQGPAAASAVAAGRSTSSYVCDNAAAPERQWR